MLANANRSPVGDLAVTSRWLGFLVIVNLNLFLGFFLSLFVVVAEFFVVASGLHGTVFVDVGVRVIEELGMFLAVEEVVDICAQGL